MIMGMKALGLFSIIPATMLLVVSFFILVVVQKVQEKPIQSFGRIIAMLLWVAAAVVFAAGLYTISTGYCPLSKMMGKYDKYKYMKYHQYKQEMPMKGMLQK